MNFKENLDKNEKDLKNSSESEAINEGDLDAVAGGVGNFDIKVNSQVDINKESKTIDNHKSVNTNGGSIGGSVSL